MTEQEMQQRIAAAREEGYREGLDAAAERRAEAGETMEHDDSEMGDQYRHRRMTGCMQDDTVDSRGRPLRPRVNDAGEPYWM